MRSGAWATLAALVVLFAASPVGAAARGAVVRVPQYGFSFTLPANWKQIPLDGSDVTALLNLATHDDPSLTNALNDEVRSATSQNMKVFAIGPVAGGSAPNVNVIVASSAGAPTGAQFPSAAIVEAKIQLTEIGGSDVKASTVNDRLGRTAQVSYQLNLKGVHEYGVQSYVLHGPNIEIVTVTTSSAAASQSGARSIANSWRWSS